MKRVLDKIVQRDQVEFRRYRQVRNVRTPDGVQMENIPDKFDRIRVEIDSVDFRTRFAQEQQHLTHSKTNIQNPGGTEVDQSGEHPRLCVPRRFRGMHLPDEKRVASVKGQLLPPVSGEVGPVEVCELTGARGGRDEKGVAPGTGPDDQPVGSLKAGNSPVSAERTHARFQRPEVPRGNSSIERGENPE